jgi:hypothetical protein
MLLRAAICFGAFPRMLDGRKAGHGRDGRRAKPPDGPARASSSPRPVIRGERVGSHVGPATYVFAAFRLTRSAASRTIRGEGGPERRLYGP